MTYFKIGDTDYSNCVNSLKIVKTANYNAQTNAVGNTVVDYINTKRTIEVGIIPLDSDKLSSLISSIGNLEATISFISPDTGALAENIKCILPSQNIEYYNIRVGKIKTKAFTLKFQEL